MAIGELLEEREAPVSSQVMAAFLFVSKSWSVQGGKTNEVNERMLKPVIDKVKAEASSLQMPSVTKWRLSDLLKLLGLEQDCHCLWACLGNWHWKGCHSWSGLLKSLHSWKEYFFIFDGNVDVCFYLFEAEETHAAIRAYMAKAVSEEVAEKARKQKLRKSSMQTWRRLWEVLPSFFLKQNMWPEHVWHDIEMNETWLDRNFF